MTESKPTRGQLERNLTQRIQGIYSERTGKRPAKATCQFFDEKITIVLEDIISPIEQLFMDTERQAEAQQLRQQVDTAIEPQLGKIVAEIVEQSIRVLLIKTSLQYNVAAIVIFLEGIPDVRDVESIPKIKKRANGSVESDAPL